MRMFNDSTAACLCMLRNATATVQNVALSAALRLLRWSSHAIAALMQWLMHVPLPGML
jgi:hypothetical protein